MSNYGNNITAIATGGKLIYIDEPTYTAPDDLNDFDTAAVEARDTFLDTFGLDAIYLPGSLNRAITVIVRSIQDDATKQPIQRHRSPKLQIKVANDSAIGISADEFEPCQTISCPPRKGADARTFRLARIAKQTMAFVWYEAY